jgi:hypothetical protein
LDWQNVRRDLRAACKKLHIPRCSPNDLRRTCATWLRAAGTPPHLIAPLMGHADSRMVERAYGRLPVADLGTAVAAPLGLPRPPLPSVASNAKNQNDCIAIASDSSEIDGFPGQTGSWQPTGTPSGAVLGPGIEPGTRGFSIRCSTS